MKKIFLRVGAYVIDMLICVVLTVILSQIYFINPNNTTVSVLYQELSVEGARYDSFQTKLEEFIDDAEIEEKEMEEIKKEYDTYSSLFKDVGIRKEITNKKKDEIRAGVEPLYVAKVNKINFKIAKANVYQSIISFVIFILYFGVFQWLMKGQTLGKKLLRLKVVNAKDNDKKVPVWSYLIRALLVTEVLLLAIDLVSVMTLKLNPYLTFNYWMSNFRYIYEMAFLIVIVVRDDQRSVHDLILNTRVMLMDKNNNEIEDVLFSEEVIEVEEVKEKKKTTNKKTKSTKKETVKAIKVNDKKKSNKTN